MNPSQDDSYHDNFVDYCEKSIIERSKKSQTCCFNSWMRWGKITIKSGCITYRHWMLSSHNPQRLLPLVPSHKTRPQKWYGAKCDTQMCFGHKKEQNEELQICFVFIFASTRAGVSGLWWWLGERRRRRREHNKNGNNNEMVNGGISCCYI